MGVKTGWGFLENKDGDNYKKFLLELGDARDDQPYHYGWILRNDGDFKLENMHCYDSAWGVAFEDKAYRRLRVKLKII